MKSWPLNVRLHRDTGRAITAIARAEGKTVSAYIGDLLALVSGLSLADLKRLNADLREMGDALTKARAARDAAAEEYKKLREQYIDLKAASSALTVTMKRAARRGEQRLN